MNFTAEPKELARQIIAEWANGSEPDLDPLARSVTIFRSGAEYHRRLHQDQASSLYLYFAAFLEALVEEIRGTELDYDRAEELSIWARGTIKNKKPELGGAARGKVRLATLPLQAGRYPGVHAVRSVDLMNENVTRSDSDKSTRTTEDASDDAWAAQALERMAG
jgi:hypothetical protein